MDHDLQVRVRLFEENAPHSPSPILFYIYESNFVLFIEGYLIMTITKLVSYTTFCKTRQLNSAPSVPVFPVWPHSPRTYNVGMYDVWHCLHTSLTLPAACTLLL